MRTFLEDVAESLLKHFGNNMSGVTVVFPGKRAGLFLNQALVDQSAEPIWAPRYVTISELFQEAAQVDLCDPIEALCLLYEEYRKFVPNPLDFDKFYHWGELMLADFDDVDKHVVDAQQLFRNVYELHELENVEYLTDEQMIAIKDFFKNFSKEEHSELKDNFLRIWSKMGKIYDAFNNKLLQKGCAYEGALQRGVVKELATNETFKDNHFVFVGFNVLNEVEDALFTELKRRNQALFYWDYDVFYLSSDKQPGFSKDAGFFMQRNLSNYGNELPEECFDHLNKYKEIHIVTATSENIQASYMTKWLPKHHQKKENKTAVVLCNELLLQPTMQAMPSCFKQMNLTMGYQLSDTPIYGFINNLLDLQTQGYVHTKGYFRHRFVTAVMAHPFAQFLDESVWKKNPGPTHYWIEYLLEVVTLLGKHFNTDEGDILTRESIFQCYKVLARFKDLMEEHVMLRELNELTLRHVILSTLRSQSIPFHGEPAVGLQVMGVLETRCLDFDHLLMLSVGEGYLPKRVMDTSMIPYVLKESYGLSTDRHKVAVYAYYFFRLISRTSHVTFVYNESNSGLAQNEISRFLRQIIAETNWPITFERLEANNLTKSKRVEEVKKTPEMMMKMLELFDHTDKLGDMKHYVSPTALNTYMACGLKYYYRYICDMNAEEEPEEGIDPILLGNLIHTSAEKMYKYLSCRGKMIQSKQIEDLLNSHSLLIQGFIDDAFKKHQELDNIGKSEGVKKLVNDVLKKYLRNLLKQDSKLHDFYFHDAEIPLRMMMNVEVCMQGEKRVIKVCLGGTIDRLDSIMDTDTRQETMRVVDYKTGRSELSNTDMEKIFKEGNQHRGYYFQTMLYALLASENNHHCAVTPCLYFLRNANSDEFKWKFPVNGNLVENVLDVKEEFLNNLKQLIEEMLQMDVPFRATVNIKNCEHCQYKLLCGR